jgi:cytidylate kinase
MASRERERTEKAPHALLPPVASQKKLEPCRSGEFALEYNPKGGSERKKGIARGGPHMTVARVAAERQVEALDRAQRHWRERRTAAPAPAKERAITVALTREAGCPGTSVAREVAARLGWPVYDHELLERIAEEMGFRVKLLESLDERRQSWIVECLEGLSSAVTVTEGSYVRHLSQTLLSLGALGECIIVGRGAAQLLPADTTLRIRLVGDLNDRIAASMTRLALSRKDAERWVETKDRERSAFIKAHFLKDPNDLKQYDLILNTSRWSSAGCADMIALAVRNMNSLTRSTSA